MPLNTKLQIITRRAEEECLWLTALLSDEEKDKKGSPKNWSIKDNIAHIAHWYQIMAEDLDGPRDKPAIDYGDFSKINEKIFHEYESKSWQEILTLLNQSINRVIAILITFTTKELTDTQTFHWTNGQPLWRWVAGVGYNHAVGHLGELYRTRDQAGHAVHLAKRSMHMLNDLIDDPAWHGINNYNIACAYSQSGEGEKAIPFLKSAFKENPKLKVNATKDPDLEAVRQLKGFKALYEQVVK
jgi:hypothetical protein